MKKLIVYELQGFLMLGKLEESFKTLNRVFGTQFLMNKCIEYNQYYSNHGYFIR